MKLDPFILPLLEDISVTLSYIDRLEQIVSNLKINPAQVELIAKLRNVMEQGRKDPLTTSVSELSYTIENANALDGTSLMPDVTKLIENRLKDHHVTLGRILEN